MGHMAEMPGTEPSPVSKLLLADEVLSPTTMLMPSRPRKQARTGAHPQGPSAMGLGGAAGAAAGRRPGSSSHLQRQGQVLAVNAGRCAPYGAPPRDASQGPQMEQPQLSLQQQQQQQLMGHGMQQPLLLRPVMQQQPGMAQAGEGPVPPAAQLQQAGHRPVVLACQLVLQQQANPASLQPLFEAPGGCANPLQGQQQGLPGPSSSAALVGSALQLAQQAGAGSTQNHLDQLKAVTESAVAAAATASAVAAATALLWQQLQQQEQARERQREQQLQERQQQQQVGQLQAGMPSVGNPLMAEQVGAADAAGAGADADAADGAQPGSPVGSGPAGGAPAHDVTGSISRSSSSSTSAAGLSAAPGESHSVDKQAATQSAVTDAQPQGPDAPAQPVATPDVAAVPPTAAPSAGPGRASPCAQGGLVGGVAADAAAAAAGVDAAVAEQLESHAGVGLAPQPTDPAGLAQGPSTWMATDLQ